MQDKVQFALEDISKFMNDDNPEFATARIPFLSTRKNSHGITISEEVLRESAKTILGKFVIGEFDFSDSDVTTHTDNQQIFGYFPKDQEIVFEKQGKYTVAVAYAIISKIYATKFYNLFLEENIRNTSVEMLVDWENEAKKIAKNFHITGVTVLGKMVKGSCPDAKIELVSFSEDEATKFFEDMNKKSILTQFSESRKRELNGKTYKVNKTDLLTTPWGEVDKIQLRNTVMNAKNRNTLVKEVYALVEDGWEEAPSNHLKYPIMELKDGTFYYNRYGLANALTRAKENNEQEVISKIMAIYKKFNLGEGGEKMSNKIQLSAVQLSELEGRELYQKVIDIVKKHLGDKYNVETIYDDHVVVINKETKETRSIPANIEVGKDDKTMKVDIKFADDTPEGKEDGDDCGHADVDHDKEEMAKLKKDNKEKEDIIMAQKAELEQLRKFKEETLAEAKSEKIKCTMAKVKEHISEEDFEKFQSEGEKCKFDEIDGWVNSVLASITDKVLKMSERGTTHFRVPVTEPNEPKSLWEKVGN